MALQTKEIGVTASRGHHNFRLVVNEDRIDSGANVSYCSFYFQLYPAVNGYDWIYNNTVPVTYSVNVAGKSYSGNVMQYDGRSTVTIVGASEIPITHDEDGKKEISFSFGVSSISASYLPGSASNSGTMELTEIPRKATIIDAPNFHDEENPTIKYTNPAGNIVSSLQACISLDGSLADISYRDIPINGTSYTFELTDEERTILRKATVDSNSRSVMFFVKTEINGNTLHSFLKKIFTIIDGLPTLSPQAKDINQKTIALTGDEEIFVRNHSIAEVSTGAKAHKEATVSSQKISCGSKNVNGASGTISPVESGNFEFSVTDNRNNTINRTLKKKFVEYINLTCNLKANAPDAEGDMTFTISGNCFNGSFGAKDNVVNVYYRYKVSDDVYGEWVKGAVALNADNTYSAEIALFGLDYTKRHTFQARAEDLIMSISSAEKTVVTIPLFDWGEKDFRFNIATYCKELFVRIDGEDKTIFEALGDYIVEQGTSDIWTYRKWNSGIAEIWGYASAESETEDIVSTLFPFPFKIISIVSANASPIFNAWNIDSCYLNQQDNMSDVNNANLCYRAKDSSGLRYGFSMQLVVKWKEA